MGSRPRDEVTRMPDDWCQSSSEGLTRDTDMEESTQQLSERYISSRSQHPAWLLLASRRAPLVISCLRALFEKANDGIVVEDALQGLSELFAPRKAGSRKAKL